MEKFGPKLDPISPFEPPKPRTVMSIESGEQGGGGGSKKPEAKSEKAPEGWMSQSGLASRLSVADNTVVRIADSFRVTNPEWFKFFRSQKNHQLALHYHPDLVKIVEKKIASRESAPSGWQTLTALRKELKVDMETVRRIAEPNRDEHPEWFREYAGSVVKRTVEHYHPDLVQLIKQELASREDAPEGWITRRALCKKIGISESALNPVIEELTSSHPDWLRRYLDSSKKITVHLHPSLVQALEMHFAEKEKAPPGWLTTGALAEELGASHSTIDRRVNQIVASHPEWVKTLVSKRGTSYRHLHPSLVQEVKRIFQETELAPEGWMTNNALSKEVGVAFDAVKRMANRFLRTNPEWVQKYAMDVGGVKLAYYHPELVKRIRGEMSNRERPPVGWVTIGRAAEQLSMEASSLHHLLPRYRQSDPGLFGHFWSERGAYNEFFSPELINKIRGDLEQRVLAPQGWLTAGGLAAELGHAFTTVQGVVKGLREQHPEWFKLYVNSRNQEGEYFHPALVKLVREEIGSVVEAPEGWRSRGSLLSDLHVADVTVSKAVESFRGDHPEWFKVYWPKIGAPTEHFHPDLVRHLREKFAERTAIHEHEIRQRKLEQGLEKLLSETSDGSSLTGQHFRSLLAAFGSSRYLDVLYKYRPEFKGLPPEKVKGLMAEYLGDFLVTRGKFNPDAVEAALEHLSDLSLREGLYETIKDDCFQFFLQRKRSGENKEAIVIIEEYRAHVQEHLGHLDHPLFREIVERAIAYFADLYAQFEKPSRIVDTLDPTRDFPDLNQMINIRELREKKRLLIADEMGLGKSASVILAKETLDVHCAVTVVPNNVMETWRRYLSDRPEAGGYFKPGQAPRVLAVEHPEQLRDVSWDQYDYILISHEKLQSVAYPGQLKKVGFDMLIVDEAHKLKAAQGARSAGLLDLAQELAGEGYLALLSGTPVPNKVEDIAVTLKLLYPEKFGKTESRELIRAIIMGDLVDLRSLLLPHLQRKRLEDGIAMPRLEQRDRELELSKLEQQVYEVLLEDDELLATEKMQVLRQFLLNPTLVDSTPGIEGSKIAALQKELDSAFASSSKIVVFVNDYVEGILRGKDSLVQQLKLPEDVTVLSLHGETPKEQRNAIQQEIQFGTSKSLLLVSGQIADVGVDFSAADRVLFYNEPWTEYQKRQELGRVYRPGLKHELESDTLIAKGTIEQGMHEYIERKYRAVEKLLNGVPLTELEAELLRQDEKQDTPDLSVNPELAEYYFSSWDKMMRIFGYVKEIGEHEFKNFLEGYGKEYAEGYQELGNRSYQANANRVAATLIDRSVGVTGEKTEPRRILDLASGPEMLRRHIAPKYREAITSMDLNPEHFAKAEGKTVVGSWLDMPFPDKSFDCLNLSLSLHYTNYVPSKGKLERLQVLREMNRVLETDGKAIISLIYSYGLKNLELFRDAVRELGFEVEEEMSGEATGGDRFDSMILTLVKKRDLDSAVTLEELSERLGKQKREGLKFVERKQRLRDSRRILTSVELNGKELPIALNEDDREAYEEEQAVLDQGEKLRDQYGGIPKIPAAEIIKKEFVRVRSGKKYLLFKKLQKGSGAVLIR